MKKAIALLITAPLVMFAYWGKAQHFDSVILSGGNNFKQIVRNAEAYFAKYGKKGTGYNQYGRWKALVEPNIGPDGLVPNMDVRNKMAYENYIAKNPGIGTDPVLMASVPAWSAYGQATPTVAAGRNQNGTGSVRCIEWNGNDMWVGTPGGGIWLGDYVNPTTYNWSPRTDGISNLAITDVKIAPSNSSTIYAATGAIGSASGYRTTGVLKSTDGGATWRSTGLTYAESGNDRIYRLRINPNNANVVWAATTTGLWRTQDGGETWNRCTFFTTEGGAQSPMNSAFFEILYRVGSTSTMYATGSAGAGAGYFYRSTDGGLTFLRINRTNAGLPTTGGTRIQMAVAPSNTSVIYLLYANGNGEQGVYRSINGGDDFTAQNTTTNKLGTQAWRNIAIAVSPTNSSHLYVGGLDMYKSTNAGVDWEQISNWATTDPNQYSHADIFELYCFSEFLFAATDGGVFRMNRSTDVWQPLHRNMQIAQSYRLAIDPTANNNFVLMGNQDCGTYLNTGSSYLSIFGGDGMEALVNPGNTQQIYLSTQNGGIARSDDRGTTTPNGIFSAATASGICGCTENGSWTTPMRLRPGNNNHIYVGYNSVYFNTTNGNGTWTRIAGTFANTLRNIEFAPSNSAIFYASDGAVVARYNLTNGNWGRTLITSNLPANTFITWIGVDPNDANHVLVSVGGYTDGRKVFETFNANSATPDWENISRNLPNVPINVVLMDSDGANTIYLGTDIGVFVTNDNRVNWFMYTNGLPVTRVFDLEINRNINPARIYAATFGRGVFSTELYTGCLGTPLTVSGGVSGLQYTESASNITSTQVISGGSATSVAYNSGTYIELKPPFEVRGQSAFEAYIQGCTTAQRVPKPLEAADSTKQLPPPKNLP